MTTRRIHLSESLLALLASFGLRVQTTDLALIIHHPDETITRLDPDEVPTFLKGYSAGRAATAHVREGRR